MDNTLIIVDDAATLNANIADAIACVIGNAACRSLSQLRDIPEDTYDRLLIVSARVVDFRQQVLDCTCLYPDQAVDTTIVNTLERALAEADWLRQTLSSGQGKLERELVRQQMDEFLRQHNTCALATGSHDRIRCTPIEYTYYQGNLYLLSEGGQKFRGLLLNTRVGLAVFDPYESFATLGGLQIEGRAERIPPFSAAYLELLAFKNIPEQTLRDLPITMHMLKITPERMEFLWSGFKQLGADPRQIWER